MNESLKTWPPLVIIGYLNLDINKYPDGRQEIMAGGAAWFGVLSAARFLSDVGLITRIGPDFDLSRLPAGVRREGIAVDDQALTSTCIQTYLDADDLTRRTVNLQSGASQKLSFEDIPAGYIENAQIVHVATMPPELQHVFVKHVRQVTSQCRHKPLISVDCEQSFLSDPVRRKHAEESFLLSDIAFMNRHEIKYFEEIAPRLPMLVEKRDREGARVLIAGRVCADYRTAAVKAVDATGAGDILAGAYLACLARGDEPQKALETACDTATFSVTVYGVEHLLAA